MTNFSTRIRLIYLPFLIVAISFVSVYTFLNWLFVVRLEMPVNEDMVKLWLPFALPWIPVLIWLRPRIKLLTLKDKKGNLPFLYQFIAAVAITAPTFLAQGYLVTATGKLTVLQNINQVAQPLTKYYELKKYFIDKRHIAVYKRSEVTGKNSEYLDFYLDVACPILVDTPKRDSIATLNVPNGKKQLIVIDGVPANLTPKTINISPANIKDIVVLKGSAAVALYGDRAQDGAILITTKNGAPDNTNLPKAPVPKAWLCLEFSKHLSNNLSNEEKQEEYHAFDTLSYNQFKEKDLSRFVYLDRIPVNDRRKGYTKAILRLDSTITKPIIFEAVNAPFEARNGDKFVWIFKSFGIGAALWLLMILIPKVNTSEIEKLPENALQSNLNAVYKSFAVFKPESKFQITAIIISLNVLVFLLMVFSGLGLISFETGDLLKWGGNYGPLTNHGQWWRLLTSTVVHAGLMHLLMNMYGLFFVAIFLEPLLGKIRYVSAYLICGIMASVVSLSWHPHTVSIGASGAIFGLYGILTALLTTNRVNIPGTKQLLIFSLLFIVINLVLGLRGNIDNAAHIGGLLTGIIIGYLYFFLADLPAKKEKNAKTEDTTSA